MRLYQALQAASRDARLQSAGLQSSYSAPSRCTHCDQSWRRTCVKTEVSKSWPTRAFSLLMTESMVSKAKLCFQLYWHC